LAIYTRYNLTRKRHHEIMTALQRRTDQGSAD
jgi:Na+/melibiose symporter-like transporter